MKLAINRCFGGFGLSAEAMVHYYGLKGRKCYFFENPGLRGPYIPAESTSKLSQMLLSAFDVPNPNEVCPVLDWATATREERTESSRVYAEHSLTPYPEDRSDPDLIRTIEELGAAASGPCSSVAVVEIPDGVEWEIEEYDGQESVHEKHQSWS